MFKETKEGQTHYENDGCGEPAHNTCKCIKFHHNKCPLFMKTDDNKVEKWCEHNKNIMGMYAECNICLPKGAEGGSWEERFDREVAELKNDHNYEFGEGKIHFFGYTYILGKNRHTVTDFGNIKEFIRIEIEKAKKEADFFIRKWKDEILHKIGESHNIEYGIRCKPFECQPLWDGNYYTCKYCGREFINKADLISRLEEISK